MRSVANKKGKMAEKLAGWFLRINGYKIICKNFRPLKGIGAGEIDLIAVRGNLLIFVEVKARANEELAAYALLPEQMKRIIKSAEIFMAEHLQFSNYDLRFDVILVGSLKFPFHIKDAFRVDC